jgi:tRNA (guanosine-2'-O-)-methyltransferase
MDRVNWKLMSLKEKQAFYAKISMELSDHKRQLFERKIQHRTRHFSLALEDMMKTQNASALMRTADAFGVQRVDIYDKNERFNVSSGISKGVEKWLDTSFFNTYNEGGVAEWAELLKSSGRKLYVTALNASAKPLHDIDATIPATICFGNEQEGASEELLKHADEVIYIPMKGFVESFNVSVSCGIVLHHLTHKMEEAGIARGLSQEDEITTKIDWALRTIPNPQRFL